MSKGKFNEVEIRQIVLQAAVEGFFFSDAKEYLRNRLKERMGKIPTSQLDNVLAYCLTRMTVIEQLNAVLDSAAGREP
jgi:hypothetical protein